MKFSFLTVIAALTMIMPLSVRAQTLQQTPATQPAPPKPLQEAVESGAQIYYLGEFQGLYGWSLLRQGKPEFFYTTHDGRALVMGILFDGEGEMVTNGQLAQLHANEGEDMFALTGKIDDGTQSASASAQQGGTAASASSAPSISSLPPRPVTGVATSITPERLTPAQEMFLDVQAANWLTLGDKGKYEVFAFIDPDCPHCQQFMREAKPYIDSGDMKLRALPIGISPESERKAALLLAGSDPLDRFLRYADGDASALTPPNSISTDAVRKNMGVMLDWGFDVTPIIVYRAGNGDIRMVRGRPGNLETIFQDIAAQ